MDLCLDDALKLDYLNGTLSERERTVFEGHLAACPGCRLEIVELRKTAAVLAGLMSPPVPAAWAAAAKDRLRAESYSPVPLVPSSPAPTRRRTNVIQYAVIAAGAIAGLVLLFRLVLGGTVQRWLPGLSTAALGISEPRAARTLELVTWIVSLHALMLGPSIIDNIYLLMRRGGRRRHLGRQFAAAARGSSR
jgi:anti-sigma factor RsiW